MSEASLPDGFKERKIGPVPEHWEVVRLADVGKEFFSGGTPSTKTPEYWGGNIEWTTSACIDGLHLRHGARGITGAGLRKSSTKIVPRDNLIVGTRVGVGKVAINLTDMAINQDLTGVVVDKERAKLPFLAYFLLGQRLQALFHTYTRGTTIKGMPRDDLRGLPVTLPPLNQQDEIAGYLQTLDRKIQAEQGRRASLNVLFKSLLHHLMTGKIRVKPEETLEETAP